MHPSQLSTIFLSALITTVARSETTTIALKPLIGLPEEVENDFEGIFFEPYEPSPSILTRCYNWCPCSSDGVPENCGCDVQKVCGGSIPVNLSSSNKIAFRWVASTDNSKYVHIQGSGRTRIEFQGTVDCDGISEVEINDITIDVKTLTTSDSKYVYNQERSFIILGRCDGCSKCEIYVRFQFDPQGGVLDMSILEMTFEGSYDPAKVIQGGHDYAWATNGYCWMRDSQNRRKDRSLEGTNTYQLLDIPPDKTSSAERRFSVKLNALPTLIIAIGSLFVLL